ncbi:LysR substrate-binding domain-containing protein [Rhodoferax sediminis]|uniref:LysR family transcriptional regulator n=1 Tax=Rhodoferax sediminis TaxID=2509614 RepID=A0A515DDV2_9BURK|nr:LysR substrate-binding domain-containing protein [Rhodoferax sediminis]QDL38601.1 LysR family transcriptional regulator [Rhodoferax sediminis]
MDVRRLKYFVQIVESGSLSKASRQLFIVQPALSQQMTRLEEEVGKPLLVRSVRGVVPTENGEALYHHAKFVLRQLEEAVQVARQDYASVHGRVTLGLAPSTSAIVGLPMLRHIKEKYPGILLNVVVGLPIYMEERARQSQVDVAVLFSKTAASEFTVEPLLEEEVFLVVPVDSKLVPPERESLTLAEVAALPLVLASPGHNLRRRLNVEFERANVEPNMMAEIDSLQLMMRYVAEIGGATIQTMAGTRAAGSLDGWRCLSISDARIMRPSYLYALPVQKLSQASAVVRTELRQIVHSLVESGAWRGVRLTPPAPEDVQD